MTKAKVSLIPSTQKETCTRCMSLDLFVYFYAYTSLFLDPCESSLWLWSIWWPLCPLQRVRPILSKGRYTPCNQPGRSKLVAGLSRWRWRKPAFGRAYSRYFIMECLYMYKKKFRYYFALLLWFGLWTIFYCPLGKENRTFPLRHFHFATPKTVFLPSPFFQMYSKRIYFCNSCGHRPDTCY